jgi:hypothetical protein
MLPGSSSKSLGKGVLLVVVVLVMVVLVVLGNLSTCQYIYLSSSTMGVLWE